MYIISYTHDTHYACLIYQVLFAVSSVTMAEEDEDLPEDDMMCPAGDRPHDLHNNMPSLTSCKGLKLQQHRNS